MDIVGPLNMTKKRNRYILVLIDHATSYPEAIALQDIRSETVAK